MSIISDQILERVRQFIREGSLLPSPPVATTDDSDSTTALPAADNHDSAAEQPIVYVGLSGGADSVCLLHMLVRLGYRVVAAHCHFGLRADEADRDAAFCRAYAERLGVPFIERRFDTQAYAEREKVSIEMAARALRYVWWRDLCREADAAYHAAHAPQQEAPSAGAAEGWSAQQRRRAAQRVTSICVGHHMDDSVETALMNLMRGTGIRGLKGIDPLTPERVVRPLLCLWRDDVLAYVSDEGLDYVTDSTNLGNDYTRNQVRHLLVPEMTLINEHAKRGVAETMKRLAEAFAFSRRVVDQQLERDVEYVIIDGCYLTALKTDPQLAQDEYIIYEFLHGGDERIHIPSTWPHEIAEYYRGDRRRRNLVYENTHLWVGLGKNRLYRIPKPMGFRPVFDQEEMDVCDFKRDRHNETVYMDLDTITLPLAWRSWQDGDRIRPFGMRQGSRLVSDIFKDHKYNTLDKLTHYIVTDATGTIVWVTGTCLSDHVRVGESTRRMLKVTHRR